MGTWWGYKLSGGKLAMRIAAVSAVIVGIAVMVASSSHQVYALQAQAVTKTQKSPTDQTITVQPGDYLSKLAATNKTTVQRLYDKNTQIKDPNLIYPGDKLQIPAANERLTPRSLPTADNASVAPATSDISSPAVAPQSAPQPQVQAATLTSSVDTSVWDKIAQCESGGNWSTDTGNGYYGGLQFSLSSWQAYGGTGYPNQASRSEQIAVAQRLQAAQGWSAWPVCSANIGL